MSEFQMGQAIEVSLNSGFSTSVIAIFITDGHESYFVGGMKYLVKCGSAYLEYEFAREPKICSIDSIPYYFTDTMTLAQIKECPVPCQLSNKEA